MKTPFCEITFNCEKINYRYAIFSHRCHGFIPQFHFRNLPSRFELLFSFTIPHDNKQNAQFISNLELATFLQECQLFLMPIFFVI